jgi:hypothetical protein
MNLQIVATDRRSEGGRSQTDDIDRHIGTRIRQRRIMTGLTVPMLADLAFNYENGVNRIAAPRLFVVARVLGVDVEHFFEGLQDDLPSKPTGQQRLLLDLALNFKNIQTRKHQEAIRLLTRILADLENASDADVREQRSRAGRKSLAYHAEQCEGRPSVDHITLSSVRTDRRSITESVSGQGARFWARHP